MSLTTVDGSLISSGAITLTTQVTGTLPEANGGTGTTVGYCGFKNKIINGAMVIDQRNAGASVTATTSNLYTLDRWQSVASVSSKFTVQQNAGALSGPVGFVNYLGITSSAATTVGATDYYIIQQSIEGYNVADLNWGNASAQTITLSFWVRSSLTGSFGVTLQNNSNNRSYPVLYTISVANTWEQKSITIAGDTSGTWLTTNGNGLQIRFGLGIGSTYSGTSGSWTGTSNIFGVTGATSVVGTNGATFYITGVQLEKGSTATSFDYRPYGTELALCQRYAYVVGGDATYQRFGSGLNYLTTNNVAIIPFPVTMRSIPSMSYSSISHFSVWNGGGTTTAATNVSTDAAATGSCAISIAVASGLTVGSYGQAMANGTASARLTFSAEL